MSYFSRHKLITVWAIIAFFLFVGMSPTLYEWNSRGRTHADRWFELVHNFPTDYNLYLSRIREGKEGAWLAREKYTSEPHAGSLSQILYVLIGRISDWVHVQTPYVWFSYHVARAFFAVLFLWAIWKVVEWAMPSFGWQILTFLLVVTASTWPKFEWVAGWPRFGGFMPWFTMVDSLQRIAFMPHVLLAQTLQLFILWVFSGGFISKRHPFNWVFLGILGFILGIIFPPGLVFIYAVLGGITIFEFFGIVLTWQKGRGSMQKQLTAWFVRDVAGRIIFGMLSIPSALYFAL